MSRPLVAVDAGDPARVFELVRDALDRSGPAVAPRDPAGPAGPAASAAGIPLPAEVPARVALVIETSGSSARPKRVALSADAVLASAAASDSALGGPGQWLLALPVHYIAGINVLVRSIVAGTTPVMLGPGPFDADRFIAAARTLDAPLRFTAVVPAQLAAILESARNPDARRVLQRFDRILVGGQRTPPALLDAATELGLAVTRTYGSTETSGGCIYDGVPFSQVSVRVAGGELEIGGPMLAEGYLDDEERSAAAFVTDPHGRWYRTGDTGTVTTGTGTTGGEPRVVSVTGRSDNVIISGGLKVSLDDVERVAQSLDGLADAVAIAGRSERWGEVPVLVTTGTADLAATRAALAAALGKAAAPHRIVRVERMPQLSSGKPDRRAIAGLARE